LANIFLICYTKPEI